MQIRFIVGINSLNRVNLLLLVDLRFRERIKRVKSKFSVSVLISVAEDTLIPWNPGQVSLPQQSELLRADFPQWSSQSSQAQQVSQILNARLPQLDLRKT